MNEPHTSLQRYRVQARHEDHHHARIVEEASFEAAAVAYLERFAHAAPVEGKHDITVIVHDLDTGHEHCFRLNLDTGESISCG
jgi:hypothetical protein